MSNQIGLVVIGRNEGDRLRQCLLSAIDRVSRIVYVDSGSTDGSVSMAQSMGINVVSLDLTFPFTAARARNEGLKCLLQIEPKTKYVQFVDGDCIIAPYWIDKSLIELEAKPEIAVVCGRRRERYPNKSIYNRLCDMEWNTPIGETGACGGDAMVRVSAIRQVGGYNHQLIAGEEPELCFRLRRTGWKIWRLPIEMTLHDANMTRFAQWWKRTERSGHAYAEGAWLHGKSLEKYWVKESNSIWFWGLFIPTSILVTLWATQGWSLSILIIYPALVYRIYNRKKHDLCKRDALIYASFCTLSKFAQVIGQIKFFSNKFMNKSSKLIEYKA